MVRKILLDGVEHEFGVGDLPMLIHGKQGVGASLFTVSLVAGLYEQGCKIVFLSGYPMARDELMEQIGKDDVALADEEIEDAGVIFIPRERADLLVEAANTFDNFEERVVLIKNIDLFDEKPFESVKSHERLLLSGNLDECSYAQEILKVELKSKVLFSESRLGLNMHVPELEKYRGFLQDRMGGGGLVEVAK